MKMMIMMMVVMMIEGEEGGKERDEGLEEEEEGEGKGKEKKRKKERGRHCHSPCFIDETTKAQRGYFTCNHKFSSPCIH